jgi:hypothetical protein
MWITKKLYLVANKISDDLKYKNKHNENYRDNNKFVPQAIKYLRRKLWEDNWKISSESASKNSEIVDKFEIHKGFTTPEAWRIYRKAYEEGTLPERYLSHYSRLEKLFGKPATYIPINLSSLNGGTNSSATGSFLDSF